MLTASNAIADISHLALDTGDPEERICNPRSYTDLGDTIRDNVTGLEWQKTPNTTKYSWKNASSYCDALNLGGHADWRLPSVAELATLIDSGRSEPALHPLFNVTTDDDVDKYYYWSSSPRAEASTIWYIDFGYGVISYEYKTWDIYVRAVRGPVYEPENAFIVNGDGTVSDSATGLMWHQCTSDQTWTETKCKGKEMPALWDQAVEYITNLNDASYLGYTDWRLPSRNELQSLIDYSHFGPASTFPDMQSLDYWSSTGMVGYSDYNSWAIKFANGYVSAYENEASWYVRAIRSGACWFTEEGDCLADSDCDGSPCISGRCECQNNAQCDDTVDCNGEETCESGACVEGISTCELDEYCNEAIDVCVECLSDDNCTDDVFCNGAETCTDGLCAPGTEPCGPDELCDEDIDHCVECFSNSDCPDDTLFCTGAPFCEEGLCGFEDPCTGETPGCDEANDQCVAGVLEIDKASVKAGKSVGTDSIQLSGSLDAGADDLDAAADSTIIVALSAASMPGSGTIEYSFPVAAENLSNGKYTSPKDKTAPVTSLTVDTNKSTFKFSTKNADLTGLSCPINCSIAIGEGVYTAAIEMNEDIVNGPKKTCPLPLIMGLQDSLDTTKEKVKKSTKPDADSISISGTFTIEGSVDFALNKPLIITIGSDTFIVPGASFTEKNSSYSCKSYDTGSGLVTAKFDTLKCTFSISIKNTVLSDSGDVAFGLNIFDNQLWASSQITLPADP